MSTVSSSAINKSGRTVAPKTVSRRKPTDRRAHTRAADTSAPAPEETSAEDVVTGSTEREESQIETAISERTRRGSSTRQTRSAVPPTPPPSQPTATPTAQAALDQLAGQKRKRGTAAAATPSARHLRSESDHGVQSGSDQQPQHDQARNLTVTPSIETDQAQELQALQTELSATRRRRGAPLSETTANEAVESPIAQPPSTRTSADATTKRTRKPRQPRKPRQASAANGESPDDVDLENAEVEDDSEQEVIDPTVTTMVDLIKVPTIGQVSEREKRMREINWAEVARKRREDSSIPNGDGQNVQGDANNDRGTTQPITPRRQQATMQLRMVDGQIVLDEASQMIDRQAQALMDYDNAVVDENADLTRRVNRMTWINDKRRDPAERVPVHRMKNDPWTDEETDRFYDALRMFGTDFHIISKMFPPRTRRQIKLKFVREERIDPPRINAALSGIVPMDLDHFVEASGLERSEFKDPLAVNAELEAQRQLNDVEIERSREEANEAQKQKDIMHEQREREREERDREKAAQKASRDENRRRKRRGLGITGTGTF